MINKAQPEEYAPFYGTYINLLDEHQDIIKLLDELKESSYSLFSHISDEKARETYEEGKWTLKQLLGHMIDAERVFGFRAFCFSRENGTLPGFDQEAYVDHTDFNSRSIQNLAAEFKAVRESNLYFIRQLTEQQLAQKGIASGSPVSVKALVGILAGHEMHHIRLIKQRYLRDGNVA